MQAYAFIVCVVCCALRLYSRYWLFRPIHARPALVRSNDVLKVLEFVAVLAVAAGFFFWLQPGQWLYAGGLLAGLVGLDALARWVFLEIEMWRLRARSRKWTRRGARRHVRRRASSPMFT